VSPAPPGTQPAEIWAEATMAAREAVKASAHLENPNAFDCGFAWVVVEPARGPFVSYCKERHLGDKHWKRGRLPAQTAR
jgi:hypothetical protein